MRKGIKMGARVERKEVRGVSGKTDIPFLSKRTEGGVNQVAGPVGVGDCRRSGVGGGRG
jgi:hypothetical protein